MSNLSDSFIICTLYASYMNATLFTMFRIVNLFGVMHMLIIIFFNYHIFYNLEFVNKEIEEIKCMQLLYTA